MARRFIAAFLVLLLGAVITTLLVLVATNGYGTAGIDLETAAAGYFLAGLLLILFLAAVSAATSTWMTSRLQWRGCLTLALVLVPALLVELFVLLFVGVGAAMITTP
jgi:hypothetical protein